MEEEIWKPIPNYEGLYEVSNLGRVKSLERVVYLPKRKIFRKLKERFLRLNPSSDWYPIVSLHKKSKVEVKQVHKIVGLLFVKNPDNLPYLNHINGIKTDNRSTNLEWCTHLFNMRHAFTTGLIPNGERNHKAKLTDQKVRAIKRLLKINPKTNQKALSEKLNISRSVINAIAKGRKWKYVA